MKAISLFTGVGGFDLPFMEEGFEILAMCEWDKDAQKVLKARFPETPLHSDVRDFSGKDFPEAEVVMFGSPCQDLSIAGLKKGLDGERSGLFLEAVRIIKEIQEVSGGKHPKIVIWENVPRALSSNNGRDFKTIIEKLLQTDNLPMPESGKWANAGMVQLQGRELAWRILNSQHFGVPQRRKRIFVVTDFTGRRAGKVLFEPEGMSGNPEACPVQREETPGGVGRSSLLSSGASEPTSIEWASTLLPTAVGITPTMVSSGQGRIAVTTPYDVGATLTLGFGSRGVDMDQIVNGNCVIGPKHRVRRLTPLECERLQGFPDGWTDVDLSDTPRYRMMGNAVSVPVARFLARQIRNLVL